MRIKLPPDVAIDAEIGPGMANGSYLMKGLLNVSRPGIKQQVTHQIVDGAHLQCPYSKATHGNLNAVTTVRSEPAAEVA